MADLSIVIPYYINPAMLALQYEVWAGYPGHLKSTIEIIIVDDGSPVEFAEKVRRPYGLPPLRIYRVLVDKPWNQHGARNLGAHEATGTWLFLTDMDHVLPSESLGKLIGSLAPDRIYTFARLNAPNMELMQRPDGSLKTHPNTFAMTKKMYWRIGGYDERFCGIYGTDALFRKRAKSVGKFTYLHDVPIVRFSRDVIHDASTRTLPRKEGRGDSKKRLLRQIAAEGSEGRVETLTFPWERVV